MKRHHDYLLLVVATVPLLISSLACNPGHQRVTTVRPPPLPSQSPTPTPTPNDTVDHFVTNVFEPLYDWERGALSRAWKKVPHHSTYELVQSVHGEVAGAYGLALIVLDKSLTSSK